jgi:transposase InsO family protein
MTVSILKSKDQACSTFVKFKAEAENSLGHKVKMVRSDRGGEFLAEAFRDVCEQAGIKRQFTAPYSPEQNGVVERRNRTVMEMSRSILKCMRVPGCFWGEAVRHYVHLLNRLPTKVIGV